jgi:NitT/TauT family transport system substrate-binding protein
MRCHRFPKLALFTAVISTVAVASACSSSSGAASSGTGSGPELKNITIASLSIPDGVTLQIAQEKGLFKQQGLNVTIKTIAASPQVVPELLAHTVDFTLENYVGMFQEEAQTPALQLRVVADDIQAAPGVFELMVGKNSTIKSVADLKGKTIAFPGPGVSIGALSVGELLTSYHVSTTSYKPVYFPFPDMPAAMATGKFDAAFVVEPFVTVMEKAGAHPLADVMTGPLQDFPVSGWGTTAWFAQRYPKTVAAFQRAIVKAQQLAAASQALVRQTLPNYIKGLLPQVANVMSLGTFNTTLSLTRLERVSDVMEQFKVLPKNFSVKPMVINLPPGS